MFDSIIGKIDDSFKEVWVDARNPMGSSTKKSLGKIPAGFNPTNQTTNIGKNSMDSNPPKFLRKYFESKEPL